MKLENKKAIVQDLHEKFLKSKVVIATDYKGLDVESMNALRRKLREAECEYQVTKNTLLRRASEGTDAAILQDHFKGPSAITLSFEDPVAPAKVLSEYAKSNNKLEIKGGVLNGQALDVAAIKALAELPSREILLGQLLSALNGVPTSAVRVLNGVISNFMNVLQAVKEQKEAA